MVSNTTTSLHFLLEMLTIPVFVRLYTAESSPWLQSQALYYICLKYICIDLSEHRRLGCPCLRLTDDDDDSRPAQMIPIALMIPARESVPPPTLVSILSHFYFSLRLLLLLDKKPLSLTPGHISSDYLACVPIFFLLIVLMKCKSNWGFCGAEVSGGWRVGRKSENQARQFLWRH